MTDILSALLHGDELGELQRLRNGRLCLRLSSEAITSYGAGSVALGLIDGHHAPLAR